MRAGNLSERLKFFRREETDDGAGNVRGAWVLQFEVWAEMQLRSGSEVFNQARIEGRQPVHVKVRRSSETLRIGTDWMARDARGVDYNVQVPTPDPKDRGALVMMLVSGVAKG